MKKVLVALLCVLLVLCFVSCGGNEAGGNPAGGGSGVGDIDFYMDPDGSGFYFDVTYQNGDVAGLEGDSEDSLCLLFTYQKTGITDDYFDKAMMQGAQTEMENPVFQSDLDMIGFVIETETVGGLDEYLSSGSTWYIDFSSESNPSRNITLTIPAQYVTQIKEWINGWTPSSGE